MWYSHIWSISSVVLIGTSDVKMIIPVIKSLNEGCHIHKSVWIYYLNYSMLTYLQFHFTVLLSFSSEWEDLRKTRFIVKSELINMTQAWEKNLSLQQELNPWPPKHWADALSTELLELMEGKVNYLSSYVTGILRTARIITVKVIMSVIRK